jgi:hypothetical protein
MTDVSSRAAVAPPFNLAQTTWITSALLAVALLAAPHAGHAAAPTADGAVAGKWIADKAQPGLDYFITADAGGGLRLVVPAKATGHAAETISLQRVGPGEFATKGSTLRGRFILSGPRHAEFKAMRNTKDSFTVIDQLLEKP